MKYLIRTARLSHRPAIEIIIALSVGELSVQDYTPEQIEGALQCAFGVEPHLRVQVCRLEPG